MSLACGHAIHSDCLRPSFLSLHLIPEEQKKESKSIFGFAGPCLICGYGTRFGTVRNNAFFCDWFWRMIVSDVMYFCNKDEDGTMSWDSVFSEVEKWLVKNEIDKEVAFKVDLCFVLSMDFNKFIQ